MGITEEWKDIKYRETFDDETRGLERRREYDKALKIEDLEGTLKNLYIIEGADNEGRGRLQDIIITARIAAYERYISLWKKEISS